MSPSQHSPMHSPAALVSQSPGPSMIQHSPATPSIVQHSPGTPLLQHSPGNPQSTNPGTMSPHNVQQQSPRIGTPHSQGDESPFSPGPLPSPGLCNPNSTRMTSPQHRTIISGRLTTSPGAFTPETRNQQQMIADQSVRVHNLTQRFVRPPEGAQRRGGIYSAQSGQQQLQLSQQQHQLLQRQIIQQHESVAQDQGQGVITARGTLQRQQVLQQQLEGVPRQLLQQQNDISQDGQNLVAQRNLQISQQRQILQQQQHNDLITQDGQSVIAQRNLQIAQQRQPIIQQPQQENISQDGQNVVQRSMQISQQRQQILQQQILQQQSNISQEAISQEGQNSINQRSLQLMQPQQRQILQQQSDLSHEGQNAIASQRNLQIKQQILQQQQQILQQHEGISQEGQNSVGQRTLQMVQRQQILQQQQQQQESISQDGQNVTTQRNLQMTPQRQQILQQQHDTVSQNIFQDGQSGVAQRTLQMPQRQQILHQQQQHECISQDGQTVVAQRNLQINSQRQQVLQQQILQQQIQQQHEGISQDGQGSITQRSLQMTQQRQQILQQHEVNSQAISQEGQNAIAQRTLQLAQQRQQKLHQQQQQHETQEGQTTIAQRTLQAAQQRQQIHQQQQLESVSQTISQEGQNSIHQRSLQIAHQRLLQQQQQQQQQRQFLQMHQQQQQKPPTSPMVSQPANSPSPQLHQQLQQGYGQPPNSPMVQQATMGSPMLQQQLNPTSQPPSPMNRISPMLHGGHHHSSSNQPPSSPMMPRSPMVAGSPMQMQRRQSTGNSPAMPDRPQSVENPGTPRTPHTPHNYIQQTTNLTSNDQQQVSQQIPQQVLQEQSLSENSRGGGNPNNPLNPVPYPKSGYIKLGLRGGSPNDVISQQVSSLEKSIKNEKSPNDVAERSRPQFPLFKRFGYFKLGLRGGSPMWSNKTENSKGLETPQTKRDQSTEEKPNTSSNRKITRVGSLVCADYNDFDDDSHTPPQASPTILDVKSSGQGASLISSTLDNGSLTLESPGEKLEQLPDTTDYDDDKTIVNTEVTLSSAAQRDSDDITVIEQFGDSELVDVISGSLEGDMQEEYVLFEPGMVVDLADSNDSLCHALVNDAGQGHDLVQILEIENPESHSEEPILSDEDLVPSHMKNKKGLRLDIVRTLQSGKKLVAVTDTPESPDQEELRVEPSPGPYLDQSPDQDLMSLVSESEVVIIDPTTKSPEDNLSKGSCDDEIEKTDSNGQTNVSKENAGGESLDDRAKSSKQSKSPTNFMFSEKTVYTKIPASNVHQTNVTTLTISKPAISLVSTVLSINSVSNSTSSNTQLNQISTQPITIEAKPVGQFDLKEASSSSISNQKNVTLPSTMASIVADAKIAAKLSQTALESISNSQQSKSDTKVTTVSETPKILSSGKLCASSLNIAESLNKPTKLILNVQPTSVTLSTPKMSIPDLLIKENISKNIEKQAENQENEMKRKKEEEEIQDKIKNENDSLDVLSDNLSGTIAEEKKSDPLNTTDELESMLEAIHNPAENAENKNDTPTSTLKRMSPVTDDLSLVNILENDTESVENDKEPSSGSDSQKATNKSKDTEKNTEEVNTDKNVLLNEKNHQESLCLTEAEKSKQFLSDSLSDEKTLLEDSSDDLLDILHNIISSKPEMANSGELKSSIYQMPTSNSGELKSSIYQMPAPLDTLPLNILQDSIDLEQENFENDQQILSTETKNQVKNQTSEVKKSSPAINQTSTLVVSTVAQLQKSTTTVPHLSPLSKPTELTSNVANASSQLMTFLSSFHTNQTTGNQTTVVTMVSPAKSGSVISTSSTMSTLNSSNNIPNVVATLARSDQSRSQSSVASAKDIDFSMKESPKESSGVTAISKVSSSEQPVFRITSSAATLQSTSVSNLSSTSSAIMTSRTITTSISITSNAILNTMLTSSTPLKSSIACRSNTVPTQSANLLSSVLPLTSIQRSQGLQTIVQVSSGCSTSRILVNTTSTVTNSMQTQCVRTNMPPSMTSSGVPASILQSTLSQTSSSTSNQGQYKPSGLLPMDNKGNELKNQSMTPKKESEDSEVQEKREIEGSKSSSSSLRLEESQNVLLKQLLQNTNTNTGCAIPAEALQGPGLSGTCLSLEAQLAMPFLSQPSLRPQQEVLSELKDERPKPILNTKQVLLTRETSFLSHSVTPMKIQSSLNKEEPPKPPISSSMPIATQKGQTESLKQQALTKSIPSTSASSSGSSLVNQQPVSSTITIARTSPGVPTNQETSGGDQVKSGTGISEGSPTPQRVAVQSKSLVTTGMASKTMPLPTNNSSNISQTQIEQPQVQITQKPIVAQKPISSSLSSSSSSSSTSSVQQQSVQQVPHSQGPIAGPPQTITVPAVPSGSNAVPLVEVKKEVGLEEVLSATTPTSQLQTDTKDFLTAKEELMDSAMDDKTGE